MSFTTLIDPDALFTHLNDPDWVIVDCRFSLVDTEAGWRAYQQGHIPGARYARLDKDLSGPITPTSGRHPLPCPAQLARTLGNWGISNATQVIAYDDAGGIIAARLWWLLRWLGHERCALLDGGLTAWLRRDLLLSKAIPEPQPTQFSERHDDSLWVDSAAVLDSTVNGYDLLLDARAMPRFRGEIEPIDPVAGHVPSAINLPTEGNLTDKGRFLLANTLKERFAKVLEGRSSTEVMHMCGSGVTACHNVLAMEIAGLSGSRLYAGSWSEWVRDPSRPIATGGD